MVGAVNSVVPAIRTRRKARHSECDEARAILEAMWKLRNVPVWVPVFYGGRILGEVRGDRERQSSHFIPAVECATGFPYNNYDDAVKYKSLEQRWLTIFSKFNGTAVVVDNWYDLWGSDVVPEKGDWSGTARTARQFTDTTTGAMYHGGAVSTKLKYLTRASIMSAEDNTFTVQLYDRVLSYDACTMTAGSQSMTNTLAATRYISSGDPGLQLFLEADTVHGAVASNLTVMTYTNNAGTGSRQPVTTPTLALIASIAAPTNVLGARCAVQSPGVTTKSVMYIPTQAGDTGIRSIQDYTFSAGRTGTCSFSLQFPLLMFPSVGSTTGQPLDYDLLSGIEAASKRIYDDACLSVLINPHNTAKPSHLTGFLEFGWS